MAAQSLLAKLGVRMGTLGSSASLAVAFPTSEGSVGMDAHTAATRTGWYAVEGVQLSTVVNGVEVLTAGSGAITAHVPFNSPASGTSGSGLNIGQGVAPTSPVNGDVWIQSSGMFCHAGGTTFGPFASGGGGGGTVTSVGLAMPALFTVTNTPVLTAGTLTVTFTSGQFLPVANGGTGVDGSSAANGTLLIGNGSGYTVATITAGTNAGVVIANGAGTITLSTIQDIRTSAAPTFAGATLTGLLKTTASTTSSAGLNVPQGTAPTSPVNGDLWTTAAGVFAQIAGATVGPFGTGSGGGSVTSVGLALPSIFTVTISPITTSGTLTATLNTQAANTVFAGPTSGSAAVPTFRLLNQLADYTPYAALGDLVYGGIAAAPTILSGNITATNKFLTQQGTGAASTSPVWAAIAVADVPNLPGSKITSGLVSVTVGGTGVNGSAAANGTLLIGNGTGYTLANLTQGANAGVIIANGVGTITLSTAQDIRTSASPTFAGATLTGLLTTVASATAHSGLNVPPGTAPTSPVNGDVWTTASGMFVQVAGVTVGPLGTGTGGSVTSVGLSMPAIFTVTGSPVITSGVLTATLNTQIANSVFAGPASGGAVAPSFRVLNQLADYTPYVALGDIIYGGAAAAPTILSGNTASTNKFLIQTGTGSVSAAPSWGTIVAGDVPNLPGSKITSGLVTVTVGGTGINGSTAANGTLLIGNGTGYTLANLTQGTNAGVVITNGSGTITLSTTQDIRTSASPTFAGATLTGLLTTVASTTAHSGLNVPPGTAPTSPVNGDLWTTAAGVFAQIAGATVGPFGTGSGGGSVTSVALSLPALFTVTGSPVTGAGTLGATFTAGQFLPVANGGTGLSGASAANGTLLIGNGTGYALATLAAGSNAGVTIVNGVGTITLTTVQDIRTSASPTWAGATLTGLLTTVASTTAHSGLNVPPGTAPTSPVNGDVWTTASGIFVQVAGATVGPLGAGGGGTVTGTGALGELAVWNGTSVLTGVATYSTGASNNQLILNQPTTSGSSVAPIFVVNGAANTANPSTVEQQDVTINLSRTVQWTGGAITTQRAMRITAPQYGFTSASTVTTAATVAISGPPTPGTNATFTSAYSLWIETGKTQLAASTNAVAPLNLAVGAVPTSPVNGDLWMTSAGLFIQAGGVTMGPAGGLSGTCANGQILFGSGTANSATSSSVYTVNSGVVVISNPGGSCGITMNCQNFTGITNAITFEKGGTPFFQIAFTLNGSVPLSISDVNSGGNHVNFFQGTNATASVASPLTMDSTGLATGSWSFAGGMAVSKSLWIGGKTHTPASTTTTAGLSLPHGSAPTSPVNGDVWTTTLGMYAQINSGTVGPFLSAATGTITTFVQAKSTTPGTASFNIPPGSMSNYGLNPFTVNTGDFWVDGSGFSGAFCAYLGGVRQTIPTALWTQWGSLAVTSTTSETSLIGPGMVSGGVINQTIPANFLTQGKTIHLRVSGYLSNAIPGATARIKVKMGSTVLIDSTAQTLPSTLSNNYFSVDATIICYTNGSTGTIAAVGNFSYDNGLTAAVQGMVTTGATVVDTTISQAIDCTVTLSSTATSITSQTSSLQIIN